MSLIKMFMVSQTLPSVSEQRTIRCYAITELFEG